MKAQWFEKAVLTLFVSLALAACGGGGGGGSDAGLSGVFVDSRVANLTYETNSYSGITDAQGTFRYKEGEMISFKLGDVFLGSAFGAPILTPYDLKDGDSKEINPNNLALFLQSIDSDANPENGIELPATNLELLSASIDLSNQASVEQEIINLTYTPLDINQVETHLVNNVSSAVSSTIPQGKYENTINQSFVVNNIHPKPDGTYLTGREHWYYLNSCTVEFSSADLEVFESSVSGTILGADGSIHTFDVPKEIIKEHATDTGIPLTLIGRGEYMALQLNLPGSDCFTRLWFDRVNGEVMPPVGRVSFDRMDFSTQRSTYTTSPTSDEPFRFEVEDRDGWITQATLAWSQEGGVSGVIDLLTEAADIEHFKHKYNTVTDTTTGVVSERWYGYGVFEEKYASFPAGSYTVYGFENKDFNQSNPRTLWGAGVVRGIKYNTSTGDIDGDLTITFKVTDNDGKNISQSYVVKAGGNIDSGTSNLHSLRYPDGYWMGEIWADTNGDGVGDSWVPTTSCLEYQGSATPSFLDSSLYSDIKAGGCVIDPELPLPYICHEQVDSTVLKWHLDGRFLTEAADTCANLFNGTPG